MSTIRINDPLHPENNCIEQLLAVRDALDILNGKWKIPIIGTLRLGQTKRFTQIKNEIVGITGKMLSKELRDLEINNLVNRTVLQTKPVTVEYHLTEYGKTLDPVIDSLISWGENHRKMIKAR